MDEAKNQQLIMRYLLGQLSADEQTRFEDSYFSDPDLAREVEEARADLVDSYTRNQLNERDRALFEERLRTTPHLEARVSFSRSLSAKLETPPRVDLSVTQGPIKAASPSRAWPRAYLALAAALLIALSALLMFVVTRRKGGSEEDQISTTSRPSVTPLATVSHSPAVPTPSIPSVTGSPAVVAMVVLKSDLTRSGNATAQLKITSTTSSLVIRAEVDPDEWKAYTPHYATITTPEGKAVWQGGNSSIVKPSAGDLVDITLPSKTLAAGDYILRLTGGTSATEKVSLGRFYFSVSRD